MRQPPRPAPPATHALFVGGDYISRELVRGWLTEAGHHCLTAADNEEACAALEWGGFALVLVDVTLGAQGLDLLGSLHQEWPDLALIAAAGPEHRSQAVKGLELGAAAWLLLPPDRDELLAQVGHALECRRLMLEARAHHRRLEEDARERMADLRRREEELALRLVSASEYRDNETGAHIRRIGLYTGVLAAALGWERHAVHDIRIAATMHDIGKIGVPDTILLKPGKLTLQEFEIIKRHTLIGAGILASSDIPLLQMARDIALAHHERWDGHGYPYGLAGEAIPEPARIVALGDVYDALVHQRVYKPAFSEDQTLALMAPERGRHFDPRIFDCFLGVLPEFREIRQRVAERDHQATATDTMKCGALRGLDDDGLWGEWPPTDPAAPLAAGSKVGQES